MEPRMIKLVKKLIAKIPTNYKVVLTVVMQLLTIFMGLRGYLDSGPMTVVAFGLVPLIGDISDSSVKGSLIKLKDFGMKLGGERGLNEEHLLEMFNLK